MAVFQRDKEGIKLDFAGMDLVHPVDRLPANKYPFAQNIRRYIKGGILGRNMLTGALYTLAAAIHSLRRMNDSTPDGPPGGYVYIAGAGTSLYAASTQVAEGLSGNPVSIIPFRPNASVQPWGYIGDSAPQGAVTIFTKYLISGTAVDFVTNGMLKVRSDGLIYKAGIKEPQLAPVVSTQNTSVPFGGTGALHATAIPWTNYESQNSSFNYGESNGYPDPTPDGSAPFIIDCQNATTITISTLALDGTVVINGTSDPVLTTQSSARVAAGTPGFPGQFIKAAGTGSPATTASYVIGAFTDGAGNVVPAGVAPLFVQNIVDIGAAFLAATPIQVPYGAVAFQVGISSEGNTFSSNSGLINFAGTINTNSLPTVTSILGQLTLYYWGDSPSSGPTASYIWKNPDDPSGGGPARSTSNASGSTSNNSFIFDATFTAGIPGLPGVGTEASAMQWSTLNPDSVATGSVPVFAAPITTTYPTQTVFANFNFCVSGSIYFPQAGHYNLVLTNHDDCIWGIGGGVTLVSATASGSGEGGSVGLSGSGQTITVVGGYPLLPRQNYTSGEGGNYAQTTVVINVSVAGIYPIEIDYDYWFHSGRILLLECSATPTGSPTVIPPLPASIRQETQYRGVYRSSATGAQSNPSPASSPQSVPVLANTVTLAWSNDPQVDVWDLYRIDETTADYTYVGTGPNDDLGPTGFNTPITDSLTDTELGTQLLSEDNYEPFPSIDLPQKGTCDVSGGVITWVSGGAIGGTATGFNLRWLAGTTILIGSPTSLSYIFIARPTSTTTVTIPGVPDGVNLAYEIPEPILAAQPLPYLFGPTDNINFTFGVGDPLRPGTLYWCNGSNLDAAADTNQEDVTDPSEALVNGAMSGGRGVLFSIRRAWVIMPNFFNSYATVTGTVGSTWTLQATSIDRGLYMPRCLAIEGGGTIFFRVDDGIHVSPGGLQSKSITDEDLYPLFPHENSAAPAAITIAGNTVWPPDDTKPQLQKFSIQDGYLYYDYVGIDGNPHTLCYDIAAGGWVWDVYFPSATIHAPNESQSIGSTLVGCSDGSIRLMSASGTENATAILLTPAIDFGDTRAVKEIGELYTEIE